MSDPLVSILITPIFRRRLNERFSRGADNQAFLVETVTAAETIKAMAVEPQMQHRWEEQLAAYVQASFRAQVLGNIGTQIVQFINATPKCIKVIIRTAASATATGNGEMATENLTSESRR